MFEDQPTNSTGAGTVPPNLPIGEVDDMFAVTDDAAPAETAPPEPVVAPAAAPSAVGAGILRPKPAAAAAPLPQPVMPARAEEPELAKWLLTGLIVLIAVAAFGGGGWWLYRWYMEQRGVVVAPAVVNTPSAPVLPAGNSAEAVDSALLFGEPIDTDADNLDDTREQSIGTDPRNWDTDGDQLPDGDEVIIWKTQPLNPDTDGDTFLDGQEVKNGYNPAGAGKIFQPPAESGT